MFRLLVLALFALPSPLAPLQDSRPVGAVEADLQSEFSELLRLYENAYAGYQFDLAEAQRQGKPQSAWPEHPSRSYYDRFLALADRGSPWGIAWILENLQFRHSEIEAQIRESKLRYEALFGGFPDHDSLLRATRLFPAATEKLGKQYVLDRLSELFEKTTRDDVKGNVLWAQGTALKIDGSLDESHAMFEQLVQRYPRAPLASDAALELYPLYQENMLRDLQGWVTVLESQPAEFPPCPLPEHAKRMIPLARTGIVQAQQWTDVFFAEWKRASADGDGQALLVLAKQCGSSWGWGEWLKLMVRLRSVLVTRWSGEVWQTEDLPQFVTHLFGTRHAAELLAPFFDTLATVATTDIERGAAAFGRAMLLERGTWLADLEAAVAGYAAFLEKYPDSHLAKLAQSELESLKRVMPGKKLDLAGRDPAGAHLDVAEFRGSVVLIDFFSFNGEPCQERIRLQAEQLERWAGKPVVILGVCHDSLVKAAFTLRAEEHGVTWRCISDLNVRFDLRAKWHVQHLPTAFVLDQKGVIVTRNEPWEATVSAIEKLLAD